VLTAITEQTVYHQVGTTLKRGRGIGFGRVVKCLWIMDFKIGSPMNPATVTVAKKKIVCKYKKVNICR
jgi:hypothetical protein